jgi:hypothetical protein
VESLEEKISIYYGETKLPHSGEKFAQGVTFSLARYPDILRCYNIATKLFASFN